MSDALLALRGGDRAAQLVALGVVNTMPEAPLRAVADHGPVPIDAAWDILADQLTGTLRADAPGRRGAPDRDGGPGRPEGRP